MCKSLRAVGKHPTTRITYNMLGPVRACSNGGIENVPSVRASETIQEGAPSAALGGQFSRTAFFRVAPPIKWRLTRNIGKSTKLF